MTSFIAQEHRQRRPDTLVLECVLSGGCCLHYLDGIARWQDSRVISRASIHRPPSMAALCVEQRGTNSTLNRTACGCFSACLTAPRPFRLYCSFTPPGSSPGRCGRGLTAEEGKSMQLMLQQAKIERVPSRVGKRKNHGRCL